MKFIELFGGIGGFRLGMEKYEHECIWYNDFDKYCVEIYNKNFNEDYEPEDIRKVDEREIPKHDCICAGFPCQSFSIAGKRKGMEDTRGTLFFEICRIAKFHKSKMLFLENVRGLLSHDEGKTFRIILESLWDLGYDVEWQVLNSKNYGVPQNRERVFIIGHLGGFSGRQIFPIEKDIELSNKSQEETQSTRTRIRIANTLSAKYGIDGSENLIARTFNRKEGLKDELNIAHSLQSSDMGLNRNQNQNCVVHSLQPRSPDRPSLKYSNGGSGHLTREDGKTFCLDSSNCQAIEIYRKIEDLSDYQGDKVHQKSDIMSTLSAQGGNKLGGIGLQDKSRIRKLTPIECERLQGFPQEIYIDDENINMKTTEKNKLIIEALNRKYLIVEDNKIYRTRGVGGVKGKWILKGSDCNGYIVSSLHIDGIKVQIKHHRIIWLYHNEEYDSEKFCINHINENKKDNKISNLELVSFKENSSKSLNNKKPTNQKVTLEQALRIILKIKEGKTYKQIAKEEKLSKSTIGNIIKYEGWTKGVSDSQRYKMLGNAVTVNVIENIAKVIKNKYY